MRTPLKSLLTILTAAVAASTSFGEPLSLSNAASPDGKHELIITHTRDEATTEAIPQLTLRDGKSHKALHSVPLDIDESDNRKSVEALWSPNSRYVAVNEHLGQLYWFEVYEVLGGKLRHLAKLPVPKKFTEAYFTPETTKSRGGEQVDRWLNERTFVVTDTMYYVEITYRMTEKELETVDVKQLPTQ